MESKSKISANIQGSRTLIKLASASTVLSLILLIGCSLLSIGESVFIESTIFSMGVIPFAMTLLFSVGALFYGILGLHSAQEEEEKFLLRKRKETASIINVDEDVRFTATKAFDNYKRFAPYVMAIAGALLIGALLAFFYHQWYIEAPKSVLANEFNEFLEKKHATHTQVALISVILMVVCAFAGAFFSGQSRVSVFRYLKAVGSYLYVAFGVMLLCCIGELAENYDVLAWYGNVGRMIIFVVSGILGVELIINFIIEFYRPRTMEENRPIFESKLLSIFTEPGGVMRNIAEALDYQFGWKVSGTGLYSFIEKALFPLIVVWLLILWCFTSIHAVKIGELGVREEFGKVVKDELLQPGIYFTKPWPFGKIRTFSNKEIKQIFIGHNPNAESHEEEEEEDDGHGHSHGEKKPKAPEGPRFVVTWTEAHTHGDEEEAYFLLPSQSSQNAQDKSTSAVDLLAFSIPIQYRVRPDGIFDYAYLNSNPDDTLQKLSEEVVINYLASATLRDFIAVKRTEAENAIMKKIQAKADAAKLGIEIVSVNLTEVHPPMTNNTSAAFHEDRIAQEQAAAAILNARIYSDTILPQAEIKALQITEEALSYREATEKIAVAESSRFETQLKTYQVMPQMFILNSYLAFLEQDCKDIRKFVLSRLFKNAVFEMNFEEKGALDLIDMDLDALSQGK
ncbi:MAG: hypothetical protein IKD09_06420 [Lentisphaeria bacterium]|nr:hypothetical protein [Lentisphaeria bacterium]